MKDEAVQPRKLGKPRYNILRERQIALGNGDPGDVSIEMKRVLITMKRKIWLRKFRPRPKSNGYIAWSIARGRPISPNHIPYVDAEHAMILCGRHSPEKRRDSKGMEVLKPTFYDVFYWFRLFCIDTMDKGTRRGADWLLRGRRPDPVKIYRTTISTLVARRMLMPSGGNPNFVPPPQAISQAWYLLFGEVESANSIRKRMPTVGWFCRAFRFEAHLTPYDNRNSIYLLSKAILKKYPIPDSRRR